jgi:MoxR-like ATPase
MRVKVGYPDHDAEVRILLGDTAGVDPDDLKPVLDLGALEQVIALVRRLHVDPQIASYAVRLAAATRTHPAVRYGASPRGSVALLRAGRAAAAVDGRRFVTPDDIKSVAPAVLEHRLVLTPEAELARQPPAAVLGEVLNATSVPIAVGR